MVVTPNRVQTLVFSPADNNLTFISNAGESASGRITLPGFTESIAVSPDSLTGYVALPTAVVVGQNPGVLDIINLNNGAVTAGINIPAVRFLALGHSGNRLLAFTTTRIGCSYLIGTGHPRSLSWWLDRPVTAFFSGGNNTAFVVIAVPSVAKQASAEAGLDEYYLSTLWSVRRRRYRWQPRS
jgi:hypothetical protein